MRSIESRWRTSLVALSILVAPTAALADSREATPPAAAPAEIRPAGTGAIEEARAHYEVGVQLYSENDYAGALVELERAYALAPSFKILYNLGRLHRKLNDYAAALRTFRLYLATGTDIPNERKLEVQNEIETLEARVALVEIKTNVSGAELFLDEARVNSLISAGGTLAVNPGRHKITATKAGRVPATSFVTVASGDALRVPLDLAPIEDGTTTLPRAQPPDTRPRTRAIVAWSLTGAMVIGAAVSGVLAVDAESSLKKHRETPNVPGETLESDASRLTTFSILADSLIVGAVVGAGASIWLTILANKDPKAPAPARTQKIRFGLGVGSLNVSGAF